MVDRHILDGQSNSVYRWLMFGFPFPEGVTPTFFPQLPFTSFTGLLNGSHIYIEISQLLGNKGSPLFLSILLFVVHDGLNIPSSNIELDFDFLTSGLVGDPAGHGNPARKEDGTNYV